MNIEDPAKYDRNLESEEEQEDYSTNSIEDESALNSLIDVDVSPIPPPPIFADLTNHPMEEEDYAKTIDEEENDEEWSNRSILREDEQQKEEANENEENDEGREGGVICYWSTIGGNQFNNYNEQRGCSNKVLSTSNVPSHNPPSKPILSNRKFNKIIG
jgi:hypothetical protein